MCYFVNQLFKVTPMLAAMNRAEHFRASDIHEHIHHSYTQILYIFLIMYNNYNSKLRVPQYPTAQLRRSYYIVYAKRREQTRRKRGKERRRILLKKKGIFIVTRDFLPKSSDSNFLFDHSFSSRFLDVVSF